MGGREGRRFVVPDKKTDFLRLRKHLVISSLFLGEGTEKCCTCVKMSRKIIKFTFQEAASNFTPKTHVLGGETEKRCTCVKK